VLLFRTTQPLHHFLVNRSSIADGKNSNNLGASGHGVDDAKPVHPVLPVSIQLPYERLPPVRIFAERANRCLHAALYVWREMADDLGDVWWDVRPMERYYRRRFLEGSSGSPNTSSKESPLLRAA